MKSPSNRRHFLRGTVGALMALPFLESLGGANAGEPADVPMRMFCIGNNFGYVPKLFFPTGTGLGYQMPELVESLLNSQHGN